MIRYFLFSLVFLFHSNLASAESSDTLSIEERKELEKGLLKSPSRYYFLADSFSRKKDSAQAGSSFLKIDPYYLMWSFKNPVSPDTIMNRFYLHEGTKERYQKLYNEVFNSVKSESYQTFEAMYKEDQEIRSVLERCGDSFTCARAAIRMRKSDSVHFAYLYDYTRKYGWPTIANGSYYALTIAIHDHQNHGHYIPLLKEAIKKGQAPIQPLELILYWKANSRHSYKEFLDTSKKMSFNISSILNDQMPSNLNRIRTAVKRRCPNAQILIMFESPKLKDYKDWIEKTGYPHRSNHIIGKLMNELVDECPKKLMKDVHSTRWLPSDGKPRLMLYVVYR